VHCCDSCEKLDVGSFVPVSLNTDTNKNGSVLVFMSKYRYVFQNSPPCIRKTSNTVFAESNTVNRDHALTRSQKNILKLKKNFSLDFFVVFKGKVHN